jgi:hypothetical protein
VHQSHGGAIRRGNQRRLKDPTPADVRARSRKAYYSTIPKLARIARNQVTRGKRKYKVSDQLRAADILGRYGNDDRISATDLREALHGMTDDIRGFLPPEQADALLGLIAPRFLAL